MPAYPYGLDIKAIAAELKAGANELLEAGESTEVRLQLFESKGPCGTELVWELHWGDPGWDSDHKGYWGAAEVEADSTEATLRSIAKGLIEEVLDHKAQSETEA